jgi:hypothetical protein
MKRPVRSEEDGMYHLRGKQFKELVGSRTQVFNGNAYKTPGGLTKPHLMMNKWGRIVSALKHKTAKKEKRLEKAGFFAKKGSFGYVKVDTRKMRKSRKMKGGDVTAAAQSSSLAPASLAPLPEAPAPVPEAKV